MSRRAERRQHKEGLTADTRFWIIIGAIWLAALVLGWEAGRMFFG